MHWLLEIAAVDEHLSRSRMIAFRALRRLALHVGGSFFFPFGRLVSSCHKVRVIAVCRKKGFLFTVSLVHAAGEGEHSYPMSYERAGLSPSCKTP